MQKNNRLLARKCLKIYGDETQDISDEAAKKIEQVEEFLLNVTHRNQEMGQADMCVLLATCSKTLKAAKKEGADEILKVG